MRTGQTDLCGFFSLLLVKKIFDFRGWGSMCRHICVENAC